MHSDSSCVSLRRADADRDAPRTDPEDLAARVRPGAAGEPAAGPRKTGVHLPSLGKPPGAPHTFPQPVKRASAREFALARGPKLHHQHGGGHSDHTGEQQAGTQPNSDDGI